MSTFLIGGTIAFGVPAKAYYRVVEQVDSKIHVLTIPNLGLGDMAKAMESLTEQIKRIADPDEPIELVGHSQGGVHAGWIGARMSDQVDRVVSVYGPWNGSCRTPQRGTGVCKYLKVDSSLVSAVRTQVGDVLGARLTSIFTTNDIISKPFQTGYVPGARNVLYTTDELFEVYASALSGVLHLPTRRPPGHLDIGRKKLLQAVCAALGHDVEDPVRLSQIPSQRQPGTAITASP